MKLVSKNQKKKTIIIIAIAVVALAVIIGLIIGLSSLVKPNEGVPQEEPLMLGLSVASKPKTTYLVGETFNPDGLLVQVIMSTQAATYFVDKNDPELTISGFDSSVPNNKLTLTISYKGFSTTLDVMIKEEETTAPVLERIEVYNFQTEYKLNIWNEGGPDTAGGKIRAYYSDGSVVEGIVLKTKYIPDYDQLTKPGKTSIIVRYNDGVTTVETTVEITVTN